MIDHPLKHHYVTSNIFMKVFIPLSICILVLIAYSLIDSQLPSNASYGGIEYSKTSNKLQNIMNELTYGQYAIVGWSVALHYINTIAYGVTLTTCCCFISYRLSASNPLIASIANILAWLQILQMSFYFIQHSCIISQFAESQSIDNLPQVTTAMSILFLCILCPTVLFCIVILIVIVLKDRKETMAVGGKSANHRIQKFSLSPHPFCEFMKERPFIKMVIPFAVCVTVLIVYSSLDSLLPTDATYSQIETAGNVRSLQSKINQLSTGQFAIIGLDCGLHYLNAMAYAITLATWCCYCSNSMREKHSMVAIIGDILTWLQFLLVLIYIVEHSLIFYQFATASAVGQLPLVTLVLGILFFCILIPSFLYCLSIFIYLYFFNAEYKSSEEDAILNANNNISVD